MVDTAVHVVPLECGVGSPAVQSEPPPTHFFYTGACPVEELVPKTGAAPTLADHELVEEQGTVSFVGFPEIWVSAVERESPCHPVLGVVHDPRRPCRDSVTDVSDTALGVVPLVNPG